MKDLPRSLPDSSKSLPDSFLPDSFLPDSPILEPSIAVLVIACDRESYVKQALDSLLK